MLRFTTFHSRPPSSQLSNDIQSHGSFQCLSGATFSTFLQWTSTLLVACSSHRLTGENYTSSLSSAEQESEREEEGARQTIFTDLRHAATSRLHLEEGDYSIRRRGASTDGQRAGGGEEAMVAEGWISERWKDKRRDGLTNK